MLKSLLLSSVLLLSQSPNSNTEFVKLQNRLQDYGFKVNIAIPPDVRLPKQQTDFLRRRLRKPYGLLSTKDKTIWINPVVFELGIDRPVLIHEAVHAAQLCKGNGNIQALELDLKPIAQARPFFKRYLDSHRRELEQEAYAVQTQGDSYELVLNLLDRYCQ